MAFIPDKMARQLIEARSFDHSVEEAGKRGDGVIETGMAKDAENWRRDEFRKVADYLAQPSESTWIAERLGFEIVDPYDAPRLLDEEGTIRPATDQEVAMWFALQEAWSRLDDLGETRPMPYHDDDQAVDRFAYEVKAKMAESRVKGRSGWNDPEQCSIEFLAGMFVDHLRKSNAGNLVDLATLLMMLWNRGAEPGVIAEKIEGQDMRLLASEVAEFGDVLHQEGFDEAARMAKRWGERLSEQKSPAS